MAPPSPQNTRVPFTKPPAATDDLISLLQGRGLIISDVNRAKRHLTRIGYYRFMGYGKHFFDSASQCFNANTHYDDIWNAHKFDRKLRLLTLDAIERIEVAMRTMMSNEMCMAHGAHWFMDNNLFSKSTDAAAFRHSLTTEYQKGRHEIMHHYKNKYSSPTLPPSWMIMECIPMGTWSKALGALRQREKRRIANAFGINYVSFVSWASSLTWTRNVCAHHGILWNRTIKRPPKTPPPNMGYPSLNQKIGLYFATATISYGLLKCIVTNSTWSQRLANLFDEFPTVDKRYMGFEDNWKDSSFWD